MKPTPLTLVLVLALPLGGGTARANDVPENLVVDVRVFEARSSSPDYALFHNLSFFIDTDGTSVTEEQWLATIARQIPDAFLAALVSQTVPVDGGRARFTHSLRSREIELAIDLSEFLDRGTFASRLEGRFLRGDTEMKELDREIELRAGQTYVWSSPKLELSASEYLSHFREYDDTEHRGRLYEYLRDYVVFLVVAVSPRMATEADRREPVPVSLPSDAELPELTSPADVTLVGTTVLEFEVDDDGVPRQPRVVRSTIPEVTPRILGELPGWRFPEAAGSAAQLTLELRAEP